MWTHRRPWLGPFVQGEHLALRPSTSDTPCGPRFLRRRTSKRRWLAWYSWRRLGPTRQWQHWQPTGSYRSNVRAGYPVFSSGRMSLRTGTNMMHGTPGRWYSWRTVCKCVSSRTCTSAVEDPRKNPCIYRNMNEDKIRERKRIVIPIGERSESLSRKRKWREDRNSRITQKNIVSAVYPIFAARVLTELYGI